jgi:hypothetical protein
MTKLLSDARGKSTRASLFRSRFAQHLALFSVPRNDSEIASLKLSRDLHESL